MTRQRINLILGTAGHIDHGKTSLVKALTGVDTDRLAEEKRRGITIELGFARYAPAEGYSIGIVDVPGHEGFVRTMVAGATGIDIVLMVVAADEGVMPQTREHLAIVKLLGVGGLVVAVTKSDLVDAEWLELVTEEVGELLADTRFEGAEVIPVSARTGAGLAELSGALARLAARAGERSVDDLARLPVDRVFAMEGAGTVVTGTLWSGRIARGSAVRILPRGEEARVRAVQVHGAPVNEAVAGARTALALTGAAIRRGLVARGDVLVTDGSWVPSLVLTVRLRALEGSGWRVEHGQRVRVHLGTAEVMARVALFGAEEVIPGAGAPAQLRLEAPVTARCGDRFVVRSYSPVTTIAGGVVLESAPPRRKRLSDRERSALDGLGRGGAHAVRAAVALAGWEGLEAGSLGVHAGRVGGSPARSDDDFRLPDDTCFDVAIVAGGRDKLLRAVRAHHNRHSLAPGMPLAALRAALPPHAHPGLADGLASHLARAGELVIEGRFARLPEFTATLSPEEEKLSDRLLEALAEAGLRGPATVALEGVVANHPRTRAVLDFLAAKGRILLLGDAFWIGTEALDRAAKRVVEELGGEDGLGPADFRKVLPVTRKHLIPILAHLDARGVTRRLDSGRRVSETVPDPPRPGIFP